MTDQDNPQIDSKTISQRLNAIEATSEQGISEILNLAESTKTTLEGLRRIISNNVQASQLLTELERLNAETLATCSFQDIIRQNISLARGQLTGNKTGEADDPGEKLLAGPQLDGQGIDQNDVDDLLK